MPRDVILGEGYDGDRQLASHAPGHHNGEYWLDDGSSTLMQMGDIPDQGYSGIGGMGDVAASFAGLIASKELDKVVSALHKLGDAQRANIEIRSIVGPGYREARDIGADAIRRFGPPVFPDGTVNEKLIPAMAAASTATLAMKFFTRQLNQMRQMVLVYLRISTAFGNAGLKNERDMVETTILPIDRFIGETRSLFDGYPDFKQTWRALEDAAWNERAAAGVAQDAVDDPRWFAAYVKAADSVVPMPKSMTGMSDSGMGIAAALIVEAILLVVGLIGALIVINNAVSKMMPDANFKAKAAADLITQRERDWSTIEMQMRSQGKSQTEIDAARKSWQAGTAHSVGTLPSPPSVFDTLLGPLGIAAAAVVAYFALK